MRIANQVTDPVIPSEPEANVGTPSAPGADPISPSAPAIEQMRSSAPAAEKVRLSATAADQLRLFAIGFLLAASFFLIEAGAAEVMLARRADCVEHLGRMRLAPNPEQACMSEFQYFLARAVSRGVFVSTNPELSGAIAWPLMAGLYGLIGGALARLRPTRGVGVYLGVHLALLMVLMSLDFLSQFIV